MHIHPPKPLHGWKEFLNEIVIIVIGVLIALGFEQVVEELHWQHKVQEAKERLRVEATLNASYAAEQIVTSPCVDARIAELTQRVNESGDRLTPSPIVKSRLAPTVFGNISYRPYQNGVWTALGLDGTQSHFPPALQKDLGVTYALLEELTAERGQMFALDGKLLVLSQSPPLDAGNRLQLLGMLQDAAHLNAIRTSLSSQLVADYYLAGFPPDETSVTRFLRRSQRVFASYGCKIDDRQLASWKDRVAKSADVNGSSAADMGKAK